MARFSPAYDLIKYDGTNSAAIATLTGLVAFDNGAGTEVLVAHWTPPPGPPPAVQTALYLRTDHWYGINLGTGELVAFQDVSGDPKGLASV